MANKPFNPIVSVKKDLAVPTGVGNITGNPAVLDFLKNSRATAGLPEVQGMPAQPPASPQLGDDFTQIGNPEQYQATTPKLAPINFGGLPQNQSFVPQIQASSALSRDAGVSAMQRLFNTQNEYKQGELGGRGLTGSATGGAAMSELFGEQRAQLGEFLTESEAREMENITSELQRQSQAEMEQAMFVIDNQMKQAIAQGDIDTQVALANQATRLEIKGLEQVNDQIKLQLAETTHKIEYDNVLLEIEKARTELEQRRVRNEESQTALDEEQLLYDKMEFAANTCALVFADDNMGAKFTACVKEQVAKAEREHYGDEAYSPTDFLVGVNP